MPINIIQDFIPKTLPTRSGRAIDPDCITIHNTDNPNPGAGAAAHNKYIRGAHAVGRKVSWHFSVDDKQIFQHLPMKERGLHAGTTIGNDRSVGIEICMNTDMDVGKGYANAAALVAHVVKSLGLSFPKCMKQHNDWSGKNCPSAIRKGATMSWADFLALCKAEVAKSANKGLVAAVNLMDASTAPPWKAEDEDAVLSSIASSVDTHHDEDEQPEKE